MTAREPHSEAVNKELVPKVWWNLGTLNSRDRFRKSRFSRKKPTKTPHAMTGVIYLPQNNPNVGLQSSFTYRVTQHVDVKSNQHKMNY